MTKSTTFDLRLQLLVALPAGLAADAWRRDSVLRMGAAVGALGALSLALALLARPSVWAVAVAMALLGSYR
jgi:hypothetical protein